MNFLWPAKLVLYIVQAIFLQSDQFWSKKLQQRCFWQQEQLDRGLYIPANVVHKTSNHHLVN